MSPSTPFQNPKPHLPNKQLRPNFFHSAFTLFLTAQTPLPISISPEILPNCALKSNTTLNNPSSKLPKNIQLNKIKTIKRKNKKSGNASPLHPSKCSNFLCLTPPHQQKTPDQHLKHSFNYSKHKMCPEITNVSPHQPKTNHTLKHTYAPTIQ